jgi:hypothetical protein
MDLRLGTYWVGRIYEKIANIGNGSSKAWRTPDGQWIKHEGPWHKRGKATP